MRIATIYDIHGNVPALEAVLQDIVRDQVDTIVVGGDVVWGPMPRETLDELLQVDIPIYFVRGNADRVLGSLMAGEDISAEVPEPGRKVATWVAAQLKSDYLLSSWQSSVRFRVDGLGEILFCHATPISDTIIFTRLTPEERLLPIFEEANADLVVCGHTHMQYDRMVGKVRVVNSGSVGRPHGEPGAYWLLIDSEVQFKRTLYDFDKAAARVRGTEYPEAEEFAAVSILDPTPESVTVERFESMAPGPER